MLFRRTCRHGRIGDEIEPLFGLDPRYFINQRLQYTNREIQPVERSSTVETDGSGDDVFGFGGSSVSSRLLRVSAIKASRIAIT